MNKKTIKEKNKLVANELGACISNYTVFYYQHSLIFLSVYELVNIHHKVLLSLELVCLSTYMLQGMFEKEILVVDPVYETVFLCMSA